MRYLSICSGIEAASVAWHPLGWEAVGLSEIEPFPSAVLAHHWPDVPNLGDMTQHHEWPGTLRPNLLVGGTPCQAFSVAGLRRGLADPRGNLTLVFLGILARFRPRWVVWENVPGVLSDRTGAFGAFLGGLGELGYGFAYRVLDAQFYGVAQRRRRVFVVGHSGGSWQRAAAVLFEPSCLRGDPPPRRETGTGVAALTARGVGTCGADDNQGQAGHLIPEVAGCIQERDSKGADSDTKPGHLIPVVAHSLRADGFDASEDGTGRGTPIVPVAFAAQGGGTQTTLGYDPGAGTCMTLGVKQTPAIAAPNAVRRLTPTECERLQGFPDGHTAIPWRGKPADQCPDGPRYRALGNSMAVPVMRWIGERIAKIDSMIEPETQTK